MAHPSPHSAHDGAPHDHQADPGDAPGGLFADALAPGDLAALDRLLDTGSPQGIVHRDDLTVRTEWAALRP